MNIKNKNMRLYAVTDRSYLKKETLEEAVEKAIIGGITFLQLREKTLSKDEFIAQAIKIKKITDKYKIPFVINDSIEVALACNADGVHIGQNDISLSEARKLLGNDKIIGVSARTVEQAVEAEKNGASYLGTGAVFSTGTKKDAKNISFETLRNICDSVSIPVVAIGGITKDNILQLSGSGIDGVAVVSAIFASEDITKSASELFKLSEDVVK